MTANQKTFVRTLRVVSFFAIVAVLAVSLMAGYGEEIPWEVLNTHTR